MVAVQTPAIETDAVVLQAASVLLEYPARDRAADLELVECALVELPPGRPVAGLREFLTGWRALGQAERERAYVDTFDVRRGASLYVTEDSSDRRYGSSPRERGQELRRLLTVYGENGVCLPTTELPDYLPLMLEVGAHFAGCRSALREHEGALQALQTSLADLHSPFRLVVDAVLQVLEQAAPASDRAQASRASDLAQTAPAGDRIQASRESDLAQPTQASDLAPHQTTGHGRKR